MSQTLTLHLSDGAAIDLDRLPNFFILGAPKCGTTSLYTLLESHPDVFLPKVKEPNFFDRDKAFSKGLAFYTRTYFPDADRYPLRGEATPSYFSHPEVVGPRLSAIYGDRVPKFIIILREPAARAFSHYEHRYRMGRDLEASFDRALELEESGADGQDRQYFAGGLYASLLTEWFKQFPAENFQVFLMEELIGQQERVLGDILEFLSVRETLDEFDKLPKINTANTPKFPTLFRLMRFARTSDGLLARALKNSIKLIMPFSQHGKFKKRLYRMNIPSDSAASITGLEPKRSINPETQRRLRERYRPEIERLQTMLGKDLSNWLELDS